MNHQHTSTESDQPVSAQRLLQCLFQSNPLNIKMVLYMVSVSSLPLNLWSQDEAIYTLHSSAQGVSCSNSLCTSEPGPGRAPAPHNLTMHYPLQTCKREQRCRLLRCGPGFWSHGCCKEAMRQNNDRLSPCPPFTRVRILLRPSNSGGPRPAVWLPCLALACLGLPWLRNQLSYLSHELVWVRCHTAKVW